MPRRPDLCYLYNGIYIYIYIYIFYLCVTSIPSDLRLVAVAAWLFLYTPSI